MRRALAAITLAQGADLATFAIAATAVPIAAEGNTIAVALFLGGGLLAVALYKVVATAVMLVMARWIAGHGFRRVNYLAFGMPIAGGLFGTAINVIAIRTVLG